MLVLHIEDDTAHAMLTQRLVRTLPIRLVQVNDVPEARAWLAHHQPDLIMTDVALPGGVDGLSFVESLRANPTFYATPVIFMSAVDGYGVQMRAQSLNALAYLLKPIDTATLLSILENLLQARGLITSP